MRVIKWAGHWKNEWHEMAERRKELALASGGLGFILFSLQYQKTCKSGAFLYWYIRVLCTDYCTPKQYFDYIFTDASIITLMKS